MIDIFISYAREDRDKAQKLSQALDKLGWAVWWDSHLPAGRTFDDVIEEVLESTRAVIVLWSHISVGSRWVRTEADEALNRGILIPILIEDVPIPLAFRRVHAADFTEWNGLSSSSVFRKLVEDISAIIGPPPRQIEEDEPQKAKAEVKFQPEGVDPKKGGAEANRQEEVERQGENVKTGNTKGRRKNRLIVGFGIFGLVVLFMFTVWQVLVSKSGERPTQYVVELERAVVPTGKHVVEPEMVVVPAGQFKMGDRWGEGLNNEKPVFTVHIPKPFALGKYEVTFEEYARFAGDSGKRIPNDEGWGKGRRPVINVSWKDAVAYAEWLTENSGKHYRLPTEAEWEYVARSGGKDEKWAGTSDPEDLDHYAWYRDNSGYKTQPVGKMQINGLGLYDMSGNVWEWVEDCWHDTYDGAPGDGTAWFGSDKSDCDVRVIRGGSWNNDPSYLRASSRGGGPTGGRCYTIGFRLAQDL